MGWAASVPLPRHDLCHYCFIEMSSIWNKDWAAAGRVETSHHCLLSSMGGHCVWQIDNVIKLSILLWKTWLVHSNKVSLFIGYVIVNSPQRSRPGSNVNVHIICSSDDTFRNQQKYNSRQDCSSPIHHTQYQGGHDALIADFGFNSGIISWFL